MIVQRALRTFWLRGFSRYRLILASLGRGPIALRSVRRQHRLILFAIRTTAASHGCLSLDEHGHTPCGGSVKTRPAEVSHAAEATPLRIGI